MVVENYDLERYFAISMDVVPVIDGKEILVR